MCILLCVKEDLTSWLTSPHQHVSLDFPIIFIDGKPAPYWKVIDDFVSHIIQNHLLEKRWVLEKCCDVLIYLNGPKRECS